MVTEHSFQLPTKGFELSCETCGHLVVCSIFRAFAPLIRKEFEGNEPIQPTDLAKICNQYVHQDTLDALKEGL